MIESIFFPMIDRSIDVVDAGKKNLKEQFFKNIFLANFFHRFG